MFPPLVCSSSPSTRWAAKHKEEVLKQRAGNVTKICYAQSAPKEKTRKIFRRVFFHKHFAFAHKFNKFSSSLASYIGETFLEMIRRAQPQSVGGICFYLMERNELTEIHHYVRLWNCFLSPKSTLKATTNHTNSPHF